VNKASHEKKLFLLFSHKLTSNQKESVRKLYAAEEFIYLPIELQSLWSKIPPDIENIRDYLAPLKTYLKNSAKREDIVLIQGDFGATYHMVNFAKKMDLVPIYATTKREVQEYMKNEKLVKESIFEFERFREYE